MGVQDGKSKWPEEVRGGGGRRRREEERVPAIKADDVALGGVNGGLEGPNRERGRRGRDYRETEKDTLRIV